MRLHLPNLEVGIEGLLLSILKSQTCNLFYKKSETHSEKTKPFIAFVLIRSNLQYENKCFFLIKNKLILREQTHNNWLDEFLKKNKCFTLAFREIKIFRV